MPERTHTAAIAGVLRALERELEQGFHPPGSRFLSARALARRYAVSYQTADRLLDELATGGRLVRRPQSGTYVAGRAPAYRGLQLILPPRSESPGTFAHTLRRHLEPALAGLGATPPALLANASPAVDPERLPVVCDVPEAVRRCVAAGRHAVLVNHEPELRVAGLFDAISVDNAAGGAIAADALQRLLGARASLAVLAGPRRDPRSTERVAGFRAVATRAAIVPGGGWRATHGRRAAAGVARVAPAGLFCVNDRLAEGVLAWFAERGSPPPAIIGFDDAPVAAQLELSTIALPWDQFAAEARALAARRLAEPDAAARRVALVPRLVVRRLRVS